MPSFDQFERLLRKAMASQGVGRESEFAGSLAAIPDQRRPQFARGRSEHELAAWLRRARAKLQRLVPHWDHLMTSDDNSSGKDLEDVEHGLGVELKSGAARTDGNVGIGSVAWALGDDDPRELHSIMNGSMVSRRLVWQNEPDYETRMRRIEASKRETMDRVIEYMRERLDGAHLAPPRLSHYVRSIAVGITTQEGIVAAFEGAEVGPLTMLRADWDDGWLPYEQAFLPDEPIVVEELLRTRERARMLLRGHRSGQSAEIYPNYKNSYHLRDGSTIPADCWVQTACFHVWIGRR